MAWPEPSTMLNGFPACTVSPSMAETWPVTIWPGAGCWSSIGIQTAFCSRTRSSCSATCSSRTGSTVLVIVNPPVRDSVIEGLTSTRISNSTGWPSSNLRFRTEGSVIGWSSSWAFDRVPPLADDFLDDELADFVVEPLPHHRLGRLALAEAGEPGPGGVIPKRLALRRPDPVHGDGDLECFGGLVFGGLGDCNVRHGGEI